MEWFFDMDGTIVDTHRALRLCYRKAGIVMPDDAFGKTWQEWCPADIHAEKERLYPNFLREYVRVLPAAMLLQLTDGAVITGASSKAVQAVKTVIGAFDVHADNCTSEQKIDLLGQLSGRGRIMWVDDNKQFGMRVVEELGYGFMHVTEQDGVFHVYSPVKPGHFTRWQIGQWYPADLA